jgi:hypothetical protein
MIYLASPFTKYRLGIEAAFIEISRIAGRLVGRGLDVYSPIAHSYPLALHGGLDVLDQDLWTKVDAPFVAMCSELYVAKMDGWQSSSGVQHEVQEFLNAGKPIYFVDPETLDVTPAFEVAA